MAGKTLHIDGAASDSVVASPLTSASFLKADSISTLNWAQILQAQESFVATAGQTSFTLTRLPTNSSAVLMFINGIKYTYDTDYYVFDRTVTYLNTDYTIQLNDAVEFWYSTETFAPTQLSGATAWYNPGDLSGVVVDVAYTGTNLLADGDMEAVGTAAWSAVNSATLSKVGSPHSGAQCLRATYGGGTPNGGAAQLVMTADRVFSINTWLRGDGVVAPRILDSGTATNIWTGTSANTWQNGVASFTATTASIRQAMVGGIAGNYIEIDDSIVRKLPSILQANDLSGNSNHGTQGLGARNPAHYRIEDTSMWFSAAQATKEKYLTGAVQNLTDGTIWCWFWVDALPAANQTICGSSDGVPRYCYIRLNVAGTINFGAGNGNYNSVGTVVLGAWNFACLTWSATAVQTYNLNGVFRSNTFFGATVSPRAITFGCFDNNGALQNFFTGRLMQCGTYNRALTAFEQQQLINGTRPSGTTAV